MTLRIITIAVAIAGCGHDATTSKEAPAAAATATAGATSAPKKPCEYMTRADAEAAVGLALPQTNEDVPKHDWEVASCSYLSADYFSVELIVRDWEGLKPGMKLETDAHTLVAVAGLGDEAWGAAHGIEYTRIYVRKGDRGFALTLNSPAIRALDDKGLARARTLALTVAPRI